MAQPMTFSPQKVGLISFGVPSIQKFFLDFLQYAFGRFDFRGDGGWHWDKDVDKTKIMIVTPRSYGNLKNDDIPKIIVMRSSYAFRHATLDQLQEASPNTFNRSRHQDLMEGGITVKAESSSEDEADYLASLAGMLIHTNRKAMVKTAGGFIQRIRLIRVTEVVPVVIDSKVEKVECAAVIEAPIQTVYETDAIDKLMVEGFNVYGDIGRTEETAIFFQNKYGQFVKDTDLFIDSTANFGYFSTSNPMFIETHIDREQYTLVVDGERFIVRAIVDTHTLQVERNFSTNESEVDYIIYHNETLLKVKV